MTSTAGPAAMTPFQPPGVSGGASFGHLLRAEFTKFRTVRAWVVTLCAAGVVFTLVAFLSAVESHSGNPPVPVGPGGAAVTDTYMVVRKPLAGDGTVTVRVVALSGAHARPSSGSQHAAGGSGTGQPGLQLRPGLPPWAKAGVILEPDTRQGTAYAAVMVTGSHGVRMQYNYTHDSPGPGGAVGPASPQWLRISRAGDVVTGYDSADGAGWTKIGAVRLADLPRTVQVGLFVTSPDYFASATSLEGTPSVATAVFDHVSTRGVVPAGSWTGDAVAGSSPAGWRQPSAGTFTVTGSGDIAPLVGGEGPASHWSGASIVNGTIFALVILIVLAALFVTTEYRRGLIRTTLTAHPRRGQVVAAKAIVAGSLAFVAGAVVTAIAEVVTRHTLAANGNYLFPQSATDLVRVIAGTGLFLGLAAALVSSVGAMLRRSAATVLSGFVLLVLPGILGTASALPAGAENWLMRLTPTAAFAIQATLPRSSLVTNAYLPANGYFPISPWVGLAVLACYTALALGAAMWVLRRRDVY
jgi:ABC-type transport system involved in multi-copper enzyme maturation permease subunit